MRLPSFNIDYGYDMSQGFKTCFKIACVAGVQRGGRGKVECEREARREREGRSLGSHRDPYEIPTIALRARIQLPPSLRFVRRPRRLVLKSNDSFCDVDNSRKRVIGLIYTKQFVT